MSRRGYHSRWLAAASDCARAIRFGSWRDGRRVVGNALQLPALLRFLRELPPVGVLVSDESAGAFIAEHLSLRQWGIPRFRLAQGVLHLPEHFEQYLRGRRRQAVRTNTRRARERGIKCEYAEVGAWKPWDRPGASSTAAERWKATDSAGRVVAEAWLVVDHECALLYALTSSASYARWLLHTAIIERLCGQGRRLLITNSFDVPLMPPGQQHFQHLTGYTVGRLRLIRRSPHNRAQLAQPPLGTDPPPSGSILAVPPSA